MNIFDINSYNFKRKDSTIILTPKESDEIISILYTPAGYLIDAKSWNALHIKESSLCYIQKGIVLQKHDNELPQELKDVTKCNAVKELSNEILIIFSTKINIF